MRTLSTAVTLFGVFLLISRSSAALDDILDNLVEPRMERNKALASEINLNLESYIRKGFLLAAKIREENRINFNKHKNRRKAATRGSYFADMKRAEMETHEIASCQGLGLLEASRLIAESQNWTRDEIQTVLEELQIPEKLLTELTSTCSSQPAAAHVRAWGAPSAPNAGRRCLYHPYRTSDGTCNNPRNYYWGSARQPFSRMLRPHYADYVDQPRETRGGLPNPRSVSLAVSENVIPSESQKVTQMLKLWGQFLDHDLVKTPEVSASEGPDGKAINIPCCDDGKLLPSQPFADCKPIRIPYEDGFFKSHGVQCLRFVRSSNFPQNNYVGYREQVNELTAFIDASNVYGSSQKEMENLREFRGGRLRQSINTEKSCTRTCPMHYLPETPNDPENFFLAGDTRINEQPSLAAMHTIWMRFHNIIADKIFAYSKADDETVFQEARRIVIAVMQQITYKEFLPVVLGENIMKQFDLNVETYKYMDGNGYNTKYDEDLNPTIFNVFGAAALRFGHTLVSGAMRGTRPIELASNFFNGQLLINPGTSPSDILSAESFTKAQNVDPLLDETLRNKLLAEEKNNFLFGTDLLSLNIMRGRDHGIPGYNHWRRLCGFPTFRSIFEMSSSLHFPTVAAFNQIYKHVNDVDLFPAALAEDVNNHDGRQGILGPTFKCLLARQFYHLKYGDRFWYENGHDIQKYNSKAALQPAQLRIIRKTSLAYVLCQTTAMKKISLRPMEISGIQSAHDNPEVSCNNQEWDFPDMLLPSLDDGSWGQP